MNISRVSLLESIPLLTFATRLCAHERQDLGDLDLAAPMSMDAAVTSAAKREQASVEARAAVLDLRTAWKLSRNFELSVSVDSIFDDDHIELTGDLLAVPGMMLGRTFFARVSCQPAR